jgi:AmmeMemoRadiSam system protein B
MGRISPETRSVREPAVAGAFYPGGRSALRALIRELLRAQGTPGTDRAPKALIVPHAGYVYSGPVAAAAYARLAPWREAITRVVIVGPSHRVALRGLALPQAEAFATPLGEIAVDPEGRRRLRERGDVLFADAPHELEHCIEVQLPFLQTVLAEFTILPLLVGDASPEHVAAVLVDVWGGPETLVLVSSDLSHYHRYAIAQRLDAETAQEILERRSDLTPDQACGAAAINGLLTQARALGLTVEQIARNNSGDTSGDTSRVVGYGAFALHGA